MTPAEFAARMREIIDTSVGDEENIHVAMDDLMVELLTSLGYGEGCKVFTDQPKWYA